MIIKSELTRCEIELIDCFGEHQSQLFYNRIRIHNPSWNKCSKSKFDVKLGCTVPLDLSNNKNEPILCTPIHFFQRLNDRQGQQQQNRTSGSGCIQLKHGDVKLASHINVDYTSSNKSDDSLNEIPSSPSSNQTNLMENVSANHALATIRVYFPVKLMNSANELKISSDLKKRFHLSPHLHEFVAYPELLTLPIDQLSICILKGIAMIHSLIQCTLLVPKELYMLEKDQSLQGIRSGDFHVDYNNNNDENGNRIQKLEENNGSSSFSFTSSEEKRFVIVNRGIYNRINALIRMSTEKMLIMPKRLEWSLALINNCKNSQLNYNCLDCNNVISNSSLLTNQTCPINNELLTSNSNEDCTNNSDHGRIDNHDKVNSNNNCKDYLRDWAGLSINDLGGERDHHCHRHDQYDDFSVNKKSHNTSTSPLSPSLSVNYNSSGDNSLSHDCSSCTTIQSCHLVVSDQSTYNNSMNTIRIAFVRRESSECGNAIASCFLQNKYSPAKLRRSRLRGTDSLVIKFKRHVASNDYFPSELVPNSIVQYNDQSICDKCPNYSTSSMPTSTTSTTNTTANATATDIGESNNNHNNNGAEKRIRHDHNKILCILTSPLNYASNYNPRNTCYDNNRLLSPTTLTTSSIASRVKWGANLTLLSCNSTANDTKSNHPVNHQLNSDINATKELNQYTNGIFLAHSKTLSSSVMRKMSQYELDRIILHPRPRIPPKRLDLANQDLELALKRSLSDCTMKSSNKNYYNSSIKKSLAYTVRMKNQHTENRDSASKNLVCRTKTVLRSKRKRHKPFTNPRRQKSKTANIKSQSSPTTDSTDNSFTSNLSHIVSDDSVISDLNESDDRLMVIMNEQLSRLPLPKLTLAKNSIGEFNVVENREENTIKCLETSDHKTTTNDRIVANTSSSYSITTNSVINNCHTTSHRSSLTPSLLSKPTTRKPLKRKSENKRRINCLSSDRIVNKVSHINSEVIQNSNNIYNIIVDEAERPFLTNIGLANNSEQVTTITTATCTTTSTATTRSFIIDGGYPISTTNCDYKSVVDCVVPNISAENPTHLLSILPKQATHHYEIQESPTLTNTTTVVDAVQSTVHNALVNSCSVSTTTSPISCDRCLVFNSQHQNVSYLSPIQPVTMWSRLTNPLPAPDPPTKLFNTKRVPFQQPPLPPNIPDHKPQPFPVIASVNSVCANQMTPQTVITNHFPYYPISNSTTVPMNSAINLPTDIYLDQNVRTNVVSMAKNNASESFCDPTSSNDLNSRHFLQNLHNIQLNNQLYSYFPSAPIHSSLHPATHPPTHFTLASSSSSPSSSIFSGSQNQHWQCTNNQFVNFPSNPHISKLTGNISVGYDAPSLAVPSGIPNSSNNIQHNSFLSYPFLIPNPTFTNFAQQLNFCNSTTPLLGSFPSSSLQSMLGASFILDTQNYSNITNNNALQNCNWIPTSY
ncbi:hypothetical protein MN116_005153 [Schistosoma mekongi]|uniref:Uncharacterized protein n=1 Tax=Schistosoma mekongi TaxID=38744 RepID=A0AAE1ZE27_SCHME|nr:hypothetical protein MN116_005153 [Schistosoma mekongi]